MQAASYISARRFMGRAEEEEDMEDQRLTPIDGASLEMQSTPMDLFEDDDDNASSRASEVDSALFSESQSTREEKDQLKKLLSDPDGNIYRGWAIQIQHGGRQLFLTVLVILVQVVGPLFLLWWAGAKFKHCRVQPFWKFVAKAGNATDPGSVSEAHAIMMSSLMSDAHSDISIVVQTRLLGFVLMLLIFFSNDMLLLRMDLQTDRLRRYFKKLRSGWMWIDAFCNCWAVVMTSIAMLPLFFSVEDILGLVLDSFGLLFLTGLDDYSGAIEYGIETSDFDRLVEIKRREYEKERKDRGGNEFDGDIDRDGIIDEEWEGRLMCEWLTNGDVLFSISRLFNQVWLVLGLFMYALLHVEIVPAGTRAQDGEHVGGLWSGLFHFTETWLPATLVMLFSWLIMRCSNFILALRAGKTDKSAENPGRGDLMAFAFIVFLRRPDPRFLKG